MKHPGKRGVGFLRAHRKARAAAERKDAGRRKSRQRVAPTPGSQADARQCDLFDPLEVI